MSRVWEPADPFHPTGQLEYTGTDYSDEPVDFDFSLRCTCYDPRSMEYGPVACAHCIANGNGGDA